MYIIRCATQNAFSVRWAMTLLPCALITAFVCCLDIQLSFVLALIANSLAACKCA